MSDASSDEERLVRIARALRRVAVFRDLDDDTLTHVAGLARPLALPRGAPLDEPPAAAGSIYLIVEGRVRLYREAPMGRQVTLDLLGVGNFFRFLVREADGGLASVAEAMGGRSALYRFPGADLLAALAASPAAQTRLGADLARALARAYDDMAEVVLYDVETRLARALLRLAAEDANGGSDGGYVGATHEELGWHINAAREDVTRYVRRFARLGLIATEPHRRGLVVRAGLHAHAARRASGQRTQRDS